MKHSILPTLVFSLLLGTLQASVTLSEKAPKKDVLLTNTTPGAASSIMFSRGGIANQMGGVAFDLTHSAALNAVTFFLHSTEENAPGAALTVSVVKMEELPVTVDETADPPYKYTEVYSESMTLPEELTPDQYLTFTFSEPVALKPGSYGIVLEFEKPLKKQGFNLRTTDKSSALNEAVTFRTKVSESGTLYQVYEVEVYFCLQGKKQ